MLKRKWALAAAVLGVAAGVAWYAAGSTGRATALPDVATPVGGRAPVLASMPAPLPAATTPSSSPAPAVTTAPQAAEPALGSGEAPDLRADAQGNLVTNAHTRDELERLLALNGRSEAQDLLKQLDGALPPIAYRQAVDAFYAFQNYAIAAAQLTAPSQPVVDEAGASQQLAALQALRVEHFGAVVAAAYFGEEEATAQRFLASMRAHPDSGATLAERAAQAQEAAGVRP